MKFFILTLGLIYPALAVCETRAVIATGACTDATVASATHQLRDSLHHKLGNAVRDDQATAAPLGGLTQGSQAQADRLLDAGHHSFINEDFPSAEKQTLTAIDQLLTQPPSAMRWQSLRDAASLLAWTYSRTDRMPEAEASLARVISVDPGYVPPAKTYPMSVQKLGKRVAARLSRTPHGTLDISSGDAKDIQVFINGRPMGTAPLSLRLPPGEYRVEGSFGSHRSLPHIVQLNDAAHVLIDPSIDGAIDVDAGPCVETGPGRDERLHGIMAVGQLLGVQQVIAVRAEEPEPKQRYLVATAVDISTAQEVNEARVKLGPTGATPESLDKLATFLVTGDAAPPLEAVRRPSAPSTTKPQPQADVPKAASTPPLAASAPQRSESAGSLTSTAPAPSSGLRTGAYVAGGVAVAALAASAYFALDFQSAKSDLKKYCPDANTPCNVDSASAAKPAFDRTSRDSTLTYVGLGVGAAAAVATGVLFYASSSHDGAASTSGLRPTASGLAYNF